MTSLAVTRTRHRLLPDPRRVLAKPYLPGEETLLPGQSRAQLLMARILEIPEGEVAALNATIMRRFSGRHRRFREMLERQFDALAIHVPDPAAVSADRRLLIGAYFTHEYAVEAAALFNPSIVPALDQSGLASGSMRFVMSLRAVGEGHLSSIEFRTGVLDADAGLALDEPGTTLVSGRRTPPSYFKKTRFVTKLLELGAMNDLSSSVMNRLALQFTLEELEASLTGLEVHGPPPAVWFETVKIIRMLATSNYVTTFPPDSQLAERVIFPAGPNESRGMEDARFVRFTADDGRSTYYATYTAYDGAHVASHLLATTDFRHFHVSPMAGRAVRNKGLALFPRRIRDRYHALSRWDRESISLVGSDNCRIWSDPAALYRSRYGWELLQVGNCGPPIETPAGWLVLTHGVGPMRTYAMGALLLDLDDPSVLLASLPEPLLTTNANERDGYVPNVVYSCGAMLHDDVLTIPYGISDGAIGFAQTSLEQLLSRMLAGG
jgi:predicted GH43/DUF377 family glycosyl hydrolase